MDEQKTPVQPDSSEEIAAAALERLAAEGHLTEDEAERLRRRVADTPESEPEEIPGADLSPMLTPEERERGHLTTHAAQVIGRIMLMFSALITALIGSRAAMLQGSSLGCFGLLLKVVAFLVSAVILGWTALPLAAGMVLGLILAKLSRKQLQKTPPDTKAYKRLITAAFVCEGLGLLIAVFGFIRLFVIGDGLKPFSDTAL